MSALQAYKSRDRSAATADRFLVAQQVGSGLARDLQLALKELRESVSKPLGIAVKSPESNEDLQRKARPEGKRPERE